MEYSELNSLFISLMESINYLLETELYTEKELIIKIKNKTETWFDDFKSSKKLTNIKIEDFEFLETEITELMDKYISIEPVSNNYIERTSYNFGILEKAWKDEMLGGKKNAR